MKPRKLLMYVVPSYLLNNSIFVARNRTQIIKLLAKFK